MRCSTQAAERKGYRYVLLVGSSERERGEVLIKDLASGEQHSLSLAAVAEWAPRFAPGAVGNQTGARGIQPG